MSADDISSEGGSFWTALKRTGLDESFADFTIFCKGKEWRVHRVILALNSKVFGDFCREDYKGAREGKLTLDDDNPSDVELMLQHIYSYEYKCEPGRADIHARLYVLACKYGCTNLKEYTLRRLDDEPANPPGETSLMNSNFVAAVRYAYAHSPPGDDALRAVLVAKAYPVQYTHTLEGTTAEEWASLIEEVPEFVADVAVRASADADTRGRFDW